MTILPLISAIVAFLTVLLLTPWLIRYLRKIGLTVKDQNKKNKPLVPISGGMAIMAGLFTGTMTYMFFQTFYFNYNEPTIYLFAGLTTIIMITLVGFVDDLLIKSKNESSGLKQWQKPLLTLTAAIPLMVVNAGITTIWIPLIGRTDIGLIYPLILIPIGVIGAANMVNLLAGFNGLEAGMGIVYTGMLGLYSYFNGSDIATFIALLIFASLIAFYMFNKTPAKILAGDSLTYLLGGSIAVIAILGNIEKAALIVSIPFFIEFLLKARSKFKAKSYGYFHNGKIKSLHKREIYSLPHILTRTGKYTEKQITTFFIILELIFCSLIWVI
jgi:UDP-N-acetylglucosamine--dolichyl-phosphate N-acetylglucosaminephosphotransferase